MRLPKPEGRYLLAQEADLAQTRPNNFKNEQDRNPGYSILVTEPEMKMIRKFQGLH